MEVIVDGLKLTVLGMGGVAAFLVVMVILISVVAKLVAPFAHLLEPPVAPPRAAKKTKGDAEKDNVLMAAAVAAVHMHRNKK